jgi:hypothetical protein
MNNIYRDRLIIAAEAGLFLLVLLVIWLDEFADIPYHFFGAPKTPYRLQEYVIETVSISVAALLVMILTAIALRRARRLQRFLRVCAWCRKVWVDDKWVPFEVYIHQYHSLKSSHGICESCASQLDHDNCPESK